LEIDLAFVTRAHFDDLAPGDTFIWRPEAGKNAIPVGALCIKVEPRDRPGNTWVELANGNGWTNGPPDDLYVTPVACKVVALGN
jgi:hypothetical protein